MGEAAGPVRRSRLGPMTVQRWVSRCTATLQPIMPPLSTTQMANNHASDLAKETPLSFAMPSAWSARPQKKNGFTAANA